MAFWFDGRMCALWSSFLNAKAPINRLPVRKKPSGIIQNYEGCIVWKFVSLRKFIEQKDPPVSARFAWNVGLRQQIENVEKSQLTERKRGVAHDQCATLKRLSYKSNQSSSFKWPHERSRIRTSYKMGDALHMPNLALQCWGRSHSTVICRPLCR